MRSRHARHKRSAPKLLKATLVAFMILLTAGAMSWAIEMLDVPPRTLAIYIERRASGYNPVVVAIGNRLAGFLLWLDRADTHWPSRPDLRLGALAGPASTSKPGAARINIVPVATVADATKAIEQAQPGDAITFAPGMYRFAGTGIAVNRPGTSAAAITVRADRPETVTLEFDMTEGFVVSAPYWTFENLDRKSVV